MNDKTKIREIMDLVESHNLSCGCPSDCKCAGDCDGKCGDEHCPCECGQRTGVGTNQCDVSVHEGGY